MPNIKCDVVKCVFNTHGGCSRGEIEIEGNCNASDCSCTYCDSFSDKMSEMKNSACSDGCPEKSAAVGCKVTSCIYNSNENCSAKDIHVGTSHASSCGETECETFKERENK